MGYYILGIIIFLLLVVFISDLVRNGDKPRDDGLDNDEYFRNLSKNYPGTFGFGEEFSEEFDQESIKDEQETKGYEE